MSRDNEIRIVAELEGLGAWCRSRGDYERTGCHASFFLEPDTLLPALSLLLERGYFLEDISGVDVAEGIMLAYHLDCYDRAERVVLRLVVPHDRKRAPSAVPVYSGANWHERECFDFFGVVFEGHPDLKPLLLPDDLGVHPLIKETGRKPLHGLLPLWQLVDNKP